MANLALEPDDKQSSFIGWSIWTKSLAEAHGDGAFTQSCRVYPTKLMFHRMLIVCMEHGSSNHLVPLLAHVHFLALKPPTKSQLWALQAGASGGTVIKLQKLMEHWDERLIVASNERKLSINKMDIAKGWLCVSYW